MIKPIAKLNCIDTPAISFIEIKALISDDLIDQMRSRFGLIGEDEAIRHSLSKVLVRYQSAAKTNGIPKPSPQTKEMLRLENAINRTLLAFEAISMENRTKIDDRILYRAPFNRRFLFKEQIDYWKKNEKSTQVTINKLEQVAFAISKVKSDQKTEAEFANKSKNSPLDYLIQDLAHDFQQGTERKARSQCYYNGMLDSYTGHYFEFVLFILNLFCPSVIHSEVALGKRISRVLKDYSI